MPTTHPVRETGFLDSGALPLHNGPALTSSTWSKCLPPPRRLGVRILRQFRRVRQEGGCPPILLLSCRWRRLLSADLPVDFGRNRACSGAYYRSRLPEI